MYTQQYVKIIIERLDNQWFAWLESDPQTTFSADWPALALLRLIHHFGRTRFALEATLPIEEARTDCRLELMIPMRGLRPIPTPSDN